VRSIYEQVLGSGFARLHPEIQRRFGFSSKDNTAAIGTGVMEEIWHGAAYTLPFLYLGSWRRIMFPESGKNIPFEIANYAYVDSLGRETVTWLRTFHTKRPRRFDAYMINSEKRHCIVDYLGTHQHLAVDIDIKVDPNGGLRLRSGAQRFYEGFLGFYLPNGLFRRRRRLRMVRRNSTLFSHRGHCEQSDLGPALRVQRELPGEMAFCVIQ